MGSRIDTGFGIDVAFIECSVSNILNTLLMHVEHLTLTRLTSHIHRFTIIRGMVLGLKTMGERDGGKNSRRPTWR